MTVYYISINLGKNFFKIINKMQSSMQSRCCEETEQWTIKTATFKQLKFNRGCKTCMSWLKYNANRNIKREIKIKSDKHTGNRNYVFKWKSLTEKRIWAWQRHWRIKLGRVQEEDNKNMARLKDQNMNFTLKFEFLSREWKNHWVFQWLNKLIRINLLKFLLHL